MNEKKGMKNSHFFLPFGAEEKSTENIDSKSVSFEWQNESQQKRRKSRKPKKSDFFFSFARRHVFHFDVLTRKCCTSVLFLLYV